jgi:hypothetical protein
MSVPSIYIHAPKAIDRSALRSRCPVCERRSVILSFYVAWYGWDSTCLRCGESWASGELKPRPFMPKWREARRDAARAHWRRLGTHVEFEARRTCEFCGGPRPGRADAIHSADCPAA